VDWADITQTKHGGSEKDTSGRFFHVGNARSSIRQVRRHPPNPRAHVLGLARRIGYRHARSVWSCTRDAAWS